MRLHHFALIHIEATAKGLDLRGFWAHVGCMTDLVAKFNVVMINTKPIEIMSMSVTSLNPVLFFN